LVFVSALSRSRWSLGVGEIVGRQRNAVRCTTLLGFAQKTLVHSWLLSAGKVIVRVQQQHSFAMTLRDNPVFVQL